jgi:hypothetical protein
VRRALRPGVQDVHYSRWAMCLPGKRAREKGQVSRIQYWSPRTSHLTFLYYYAALLSEHSKVSVFLQAYARTNVGTVRPDLPKRIHLNDSRSLHTARISYFRNLPCALRRPDRNSAAPGTYRCRFSRNIHASMLRPTVSTKIKPMTQGGRRTHCYELARQSKSLVGVRTRLIFHAKDCTPASRKNGLPGVLLFHPPTFLNISVVLGSFVEWVLLAHDGSHAGWTYRILLCPRTTAGMSCMPIEELLDLMRQALGFLHLHNPHVNYFDGVRTMQRDATLLVPVCQFSTTHPTELEFTARIRKVDLVRSPSIFGGSSRSSCN